MKKKKRSFLEKIISFFENHKIVLIINLVFILVFGLLLFYWSKNTKSGQVNNSEVRVEISGAVKKPGVYSLKNGKIVEDLIKMSGGLTEKADSKKVVENINRAELLNDGQKVVIPEKGENPVSENQAQILSESTTSNINSSSNSISQIQGKVNLNTAGLSELDTLPRIGPAYAQRIIDYRTANGGFKSIEEIKNVKGIGDKTFEKLKAYIII